MYVTRYPSVCGYMCEYVQEKDNARRSIQKPFSSRLTIPCFQKVFDSCSYRHMHACSSSTRGHLITEYLLHVASRLPPNECISVDLPRPLSVRGAYASRDKSKYLCGRTHIGRSRSFYSSSKLAPAGGNSAHPAPSCSPPR